MPAARVGGVIAVAEPCVPVMTIEVSATLVTDSIACAVAATVPDVALIFALVFAAASVVVAKPKVVVLITTPDADELHVTLDVMFLLDWSV